MENASEQPQINKKSIFSLLGPYRGSIAILAAVSVASSGLGLVLPKIVSHAIDAFIHQTFDVHKFVFEYGAIILLIAVLAYFQSFVQSYTSERVARDLRNTVAKKISEQSYSFIEKVTPSKLLTNLTSDVDSIKMFVGQAIATLISSLVIVVGAAIILLTINWKLGLAVLAVVPIIGILFSFIFSRVRVLMKKSREIIDWLNKVINESILGASLVRVLYSEKEEIEKFKDANQKARETGLKILNMFASLIPAITFIANLAILIVLALGGKFVIASNMTLGDFSAFNSYIFLLIFPLLMIGIMSSIISQSQAAYERIQEVLDAPPEKEGGTVKGELKGNIELTHISLNYGEKEVLKDISFKVLPRSKTAIIGPTAAGKTQLLYLLTRLMEPTSGEILYDGVNISEYETENLHKQIGFVFQDSIIFNLTLRENIAFGGKGSRENLDKAIITAELSDFVLSLPQGLDTIISERGSSLSGGQKQRIMLARALALNPKILLLDDFTARVDSKTEQKILENVQKNYPEVTLVSVTQKIASIEKYDQVILMEEGQVVASGTHAELLKSSPEYIQIYDSQKSTSRYE